MLGLTLLKGVLGYVRTDEFNSDMVTSDGPYTYTPIAVWEYVAGHDSFTITPNDTCGLHLHGLRSLFDNPHGGAGRDWLFGGSDNDVLKGGAGRDVVHGGRGDDHLSGGTGKDVLHGGRGNDLLEGGKGDDRLRGGEGVDTFVFKPGFGHDIITDFDGDMLQFDPAVFANADAVRSHAAQVGDHVVIAYDAYNTVTLVGVVLNNVLPGGNGNEDGNDGGGVIV